MRLFIAVAFDSSAKQKISGLYDTLHREGVSGSFTPVDNLHLTLKFLGEVDKTRLEAVKAALNNAASAVDRFEIKSTGCGYFPSRGEKTVWLGMDGERLTSLAQSVDEAVSRLGFEREKRAFTPHVTIVRRAELGPAVLSRINVPEISFAVESATLFESRRDNGRLWYKPLYKASLRG